MTKLHVLRPGIPTGPLTLDELRAMVRAGTDRAEIVVFDAAGGVAVPCLAAGALPEMLLGLKAAGRAAVAGQGFYGLVQGALHLGVELFVLQFLA